MAGIPFCKRNTQIRTTAATEMPAAIKKNPCISLSIRQYFPLLKNPALFVRQPSAFLKSLYFINFSAFFISPFPDCIFSQLLRTNFQKRCVSSVCSICQLFPGRNLADINCFYLLTGQFCHTTFFIYDYCNTVLSNHS